MAPSETPVAQDEPLRLRGEKDLGECRFRMVESGFFKELKL